MPVQQIHVSPVELQPDDVDGSYLCDKEAQILCRNTPPLNGSQSSSISSASYDICRICHCEGDSEVPLIAPCYCAGSLRYVHQACLQQWIKSSNIRSCELCKFQFIMQTKTKPFSEWEHLEMSGFERRKLLCAIMFHAVALTCVVWSLYVLIDRTAEEIQNGLLEWPFWTKLIVVAIGFTGGVVFMYIQCKAYLQICQRWKDFNRVIYVQNAPEKPSLSSPIAQLHVVPSQPLIGPSHSGAFDGQPTSAECKFKPFQGSSKDGGSKPEGGTSIDLKNVRNLHIFFNDENRIRVQKDDTESCTVDLENINNENLESAVVPQREGHPEGNGTWHIQIGKTKDNQVTRGKVKDMINPSCSHKSYEENYDGILVPAEEGCKLWGSNGADKLTKNNESGPTVKESPVLKLQIKKAEIVIKFGQEDKPCLIQSEDKKKDEKTLSDTLNIQINKVPELPMIKCLNEYDPLNPHNDLVCKRQKYFPQECVSPTVKLLSQHSWNPETKSNEPSSGSETPLLTSKDMEEFPTINKVD